LIKSFRSLLPEYFPDADEEATEKEDESHTRLSQNLEEAAINSTSAEEDTQVKSV
jgi:hypothetical protein